MIVSMFATVVAVLVVHGRSFLLISVCHIVSDYLQVLKTWERQLVLLVLTSQVWSLAMFSLLLVHKMRNVLLMHENVCFHVNKTKNKLVVPVDSIKRLNPINPARLKHLLVDVRS